MKAFIKNISYYLPENIVTNEDLAHQFPEWSVEKIANKIGVNERHVSAENETALDLGLKSAEKLFTEHNIDKSDIDFVLFCTQSPDYFLPTSACVIQEKLHLRNNIGALDFNLGCSGFVYGLALAKGLIVSNMAKNVLLITAETYTKYIHPKDKGNKTIFGDGAASTLVSVEGYAEIGNFSFGTDGSGCDNLIVKTGGMRNHSKLNDEKYDEKGNVTSSDHLFMDGSEIFHFTSDAVPILIDDILKKNTLELIDVELFIFHQANKYMLNYLRKLIGIEKEHFYIHMAEVGNTVSSTIPIALYHAKAEGRLDKNIVLAGFGVGYSWGGVNLIVQ